MATLGDTSGSNAKLPVESRILIFGPWHQAIRTISSTKKHIVRVVLSLQLFFFDLNLFLASIVILPGDSFGPHH